MFVRFVEAMKIESQRTRDERHSDDSHCSLDDFYHTHVSTSHHKHTAVSVSHHHNQADDMCSTCGVETCSGDTIQRVEASPVMTRVHNFLHHKRPHSEQHAAHHNHHMTHAAGNSLSPNHSVSTLSREALTYARFSSTLAAGGRDHVDHTAPHVVNLHLEPISENGPHHSTTTTTAVTHSPPDAAPNALTISTQSSQDTSVTSNYSKIKCPPQDSPTVTSSSPVEIQVKTDQLQFADEDDQSPVRGDKVTCGKRSHDDRTYSLPSYDDVVQSTGSVSARTDKSPVANAVQPDATEHTDG